MNPVQFARTIYLGDRACKSILLDGWNDRILFQVDVISRIRSTSGNWEFYNDEDIVDGYLVFTGVESCHFDPQGFLPNDLIYGFDVEPTRTDARNDNDEELFLFTLQVGSGKRRGSYATVLVQIIAEGVHLEDPARPTEKIIE